MAKIAEIPLDLHDNAKVRNYCKPKNRLNLLMFLQCAVDGVHGEVTVIFVIPLNFHLTTNFHFSCGPLQNSASHK